MATTLTKLLTAADLLRLDSQGVRGELIGGVLYETMPTGLEHGKIAATLTILLGIFIMPRKLGTLGDLGRGASGWSVTPIPCVSRTLPTSRRRGCRRACGLRAMPRWYPT